jgi:membrane-associated phospholipid phosphatase
LNAMATAVTVDRFLRWWPPIGVLAMLVLGLLVGKSSTPIDVWFARDADRAVGPSEHWLLIFTEWWFLVPVLVACLMVALYRRRWRLAIVILACPLVAISIVRVLKPLFDRVKDGTLVYPSGHTTLMVTIMGMVVLIAGGRLWAVLVGVIASLLGMFGLACTYHFLTDTIGAAMLASAVVCVAARVAQAPAGALQLEAKP